MWSPPIIYPKSRKCPSKLVRSADCQLVLVSSYGKYTAFQNEMLRFHSSNIYNSLKIEECTCIDSVISGDETSDTRSKVKCNVKTQNKKCKRRNSHTKKSKLSKIKDDNHTFIEIYTINVFGRDTPLVSHSKYISRSDVKQHVQRITSGIINTHIVLTCNGLVNFDVISPGDKVRVEVGLAGGGRKKLALEIHPEKKCTECYICKVQNVIGETYCYLIRRQEKTSFVNYVRSKYQKIKDDSCICRRCERKMEREMLITESADPPPNKKARTECSAKQHLGISGCDSEIHVSEWDLYTVMAGLKYQDVTKSNVDNVALCRKHYSVTYDFKKCRTVRCCACNVYLGEKNSLSKKYNFEFSEIDTELFMMLSNIATEEFRCKVDVAENSLFCRKCYVKMTEIISQNKTVFQNPAIHKPILHDIMSTHPFEEVVNSCPDSEKIEEVVFNSSVNHLAQVFLSQRVMILRELYVWYKKVQNLEVSKNMEMTFLKLP